MLNQAGREAVVVRGGDSLPVFIAGASSAMRLRQTVRVVREGAQVAGSARRLPTSGQRRINYMALIGRKNPLSSTRA